MGWFTKDAEKIEIDVLKARNLYAGIQVVVDRQIKYIQKLADEGKIPLTAQTNFIDLYRQFREIDYEIERKLKDPKTELDYEKIMKVLTITAKLVDVII